MAAVNSRRFDEQLFVPLRTSPLWQKYRVQMINKKQHEIEECVRGSSSTGNSTTKKKPHSRN